MVRGAELKPTKAPRYPSKLSQEVPACVEGVPVSCIVDYCEATPRAEENTLVYRHPIKRWREPEISDSLLYFPQQSQGSSLQGEEKEEGGIGKWFGGSSGVFSLGFTKTD